MWFLLSLYLGLQSRELTLSTRDLGARYKQFLRNLFSFISTVKSLMYRPFPLPSSLTPSPLLCIEQDYFVRYIFKEFRLWSGLEDWWWKMWGQEKRKKTKKRETSLTCSFFCPCSLSECQMFKLVIYNGI